MHLRTRFLSFAIIFALFISLSAFARAEDDDSPPRRKLLERLKKRFDKDGDGRLNGEERRALWKFIRKWREARRKKGNSVEEKWARGPLAIQIVNDLTLRDKERKKDLPLRVTFPKEKGKYPLIVFSHGALGSKKNYQPLVQYWASHGFVCIQPTHEDSLSLKKNKENLKNPKTLLARAFQHWQSRPLDIRFILRSLKRMEEKIPSLKGKIDSEHLGVGGHSFGAHTSQLVGGVLIFPPGPKKRPRSFRLRNVDAVLLISPQGMTEKKGSTGGNFRKKSWKPLTIPALVITGSKDGSKKTGQTPTTRRHPYKYSPPGDKYLLFITGADHGFGGITGNPLSTMRHGENDRHVQLVQKSSLRFWQAYLKGGKKAKKKLKNHWLEKVSKEVEMKSK